ncbi:MAG: amino acid permease [Pyrinomonadaceae bacterium]|nr:amino acid permease [Pyrinomonadaceae bacterium]
MPIERVSSGETFAAQAGEALFGRAGGQVFAGIVIVSVLGSLAAIVMAAPRVYYAMACDGLFLAAAAEVHPRFGTPVRAIALQSALACLLVTLGTFNEIVAYFLFTTIVFIALAVAGVILLRRKQPDRLVAYSTLGYPVTPVIFLLFSVVLLMMLAGNNIKQTLLGVAIVLAGVPIYYLIFRRRRIHNS